MRIETFICPAMQEGGIFSIVGRYTFIINRLICSIKEHSEWITAVFPSNARIAVDYRSLLPNSTHPPFRMK